MPPHRVCPSAPCVPASCPPDVRGARPSERPPSGSGGGGGPGRRLIARANSNRNRNRTSTARTLEWTTNLVSKTNATPKIRKIGKPSANDRHSPPPPCLRDNGTRRRNGTHGWGFQMVERNLSSGVAGFDCDIGQKPPEWCFLAGTEKTRVPANAPGHGNLIQKNPDGDGGFLFWDRHSLSRPGNARKLKTFECIQNHPENVI